jgi:dihydroflavonol-4-reductase
VPADVPVESVRMARQRMYYDASKAVRELGMPQHSVTQALADAVTWFEDHHHSTQFSPEDRWRSVSSKP